MAEPLQNMGFLSQQLAKMGTPNEVPVYTRPASDPLPVGFAAGVSNPAQVTFTVPTPPVAGANLPTYKGGLSKEHKAAVATNRTASDVVKEQLGQARANYADATERGNQALLVDAELSATIAAEAARMDAARRQVLIDQQDAVGINDAIVNGNRIIAANTQRYLLNQEALANARAETSLTGDPLRWLQLQVQGGSIEKQLGTLAAQTKAVEGAVKDLGLHADNNAAILKARLPEKTAEREAAEMSRLATLAAQKISESDVKASVSDANFVTNIFSLYEGDVRREAGFDSARLGEEWKRYQSEMDKLLGEGRIAEAKISAMRWQELEKQSGLRVIGIDRLAKQLGVTPEVAAARWDNTTGKEKMILLNVAFDGAPKTYEEAASIASISNIDALRADPATQGSAIVVDTLRKVPKLFDAALDNGKIKIGKNAIDRDAYMQLTDKEKAAELERFYRGLDMQEQVIKEMATSSLPAIAATSQQRTAALMPTVAPLISSLRPTNTNTDALRLLSEGTVDEAGNIDKNKIKVISGELSRFYRQRVVDIKAAAANLPIKQYTGQDAKPVGEVSAVEEVQLLRPSLVYAGGGTPVSLQLDMADSAAIETAMLMQAESIKLKNTPNAFTSAVDTYGRNIAGTTR